MNAASGSGSNVGSGQNGATGPGGALARGRAAAASAELEISRAWLVDPATGREGPGELVVRDGVLRAVTWLRGADAAGVGPDGVIVVPGFTDLHAHLREPGDEAAETIASGLAAAAHGGFTTVCAMADTTPAADEPGVLIRVRALAAASGSPDDADPAGAASRWLLGGALAILLISMLGRATRRRH